MEAWRNLAVHVVVRAAIDAASSNERHKQEALDWLNSQEGRSIIAIFGLIVPGAISPQDLRVPTRNVYFNGNSGSVARATVWPAMTPAESE